MPGIGIMVHTRAQQLAWRQRVALTHKYVYMYCRTVVHVHMMTVCPNLGYIPHVTDIKYVYMCDSTCTHDDSVCQLGVYTSCY